MTNEDALTAEALTVYGLELRLIRDSPSVRVWRGVHAEVGTVRAELIDKGRPSPSWIVRRTSTLSRLPHGSRFRSRTQIVVYGTGETLEAALASLQRAEDDVDMLRLEPSLRRLTQDLREEAERFRRRANKLASTRVDGGPRG